MWRRIAVWKPFFEMSTNLGLMTVQRLSGSSVTRSMNVNGSLFKFAKRTAIKLMVVLVLRTNLVCRIGAICMMVSRMLKLRRLRARLFAPQVAGVSN
jgi:hypothetical protein